MRSKILHILQHKIVDQQKKEKEYFDSLSEEQDIFLLNKVM